MRQERTEERRKMFQAANRRRRGESGNLDDLDNAPFNKWKTLLGNMPSDKTTDKTSKEVIAQKKVLKQESHKIKGMLLKIFHRVTFFNTSRSRMCKTTKFIIFLS